MSDSTTDIDWLAFQYVTGELADDAAAEFESRLAVDQAACEAVSRMVLLNQAVVVGERRVPVSAATAASRGACPQSRPQRLSTRQWIAACASVAALLVCGVWWTSPAGFWSQEALAQRELAPDVVSIWADSATDEEFTPSPVLLTSALNSDAADLVDDDGPGSVPNWLFVALERERSLEEEDGQIMQE